MSQKRYLFVFGVSVLFLTAFSRAWAQTPFDQAKKAYIATLNTYREKEQAFSIAHEQYLQVQTLASLEETTRASRDVQLARIDTLLAYFQTLDTYLGDIKGLDITQKTAQQKAIQQRIGELQQLLIEVTNATDRVQLDAASLKYTKNQEVYTGTAYAALALSKIALLQSSIDQLNVVSDQLRAMIAAPDVSATTRTQKERGLDELSRTLDGAKTAIKQAQQLVEQSGTTKLELSTFMRTIDTLNGGYAKILQAENFVRELAKFGAS